MSLEKLKAGLMQNFLGKAKCNIGDVKVANDEKFISEDPVFKLAQIIQTKKSKVAKTTILTTIFFLFNPLAKGIISNQTYNISEKAIYSYGICYRAKLLHGFNSNKINLDLILLHQIATWETTSPLVY